MSKSIRTAALTAVLSFAAVPALHADRMGTNPHPQIGVASTPSILNAVTYATLSYFGL